MLESKNETYAMCGANDPVGAVLHDVPLLTTCDSNLTQAACTEGKKRMNEIQTDKQKRGNLER